MKKTVIKAYIRQSQDRKKSSQSRTLSAERAKLKLPYKPEHLTEDELRRGLARLAA